jgi:glycosyltransferase involved in cell wall biosynthesis
LARGKKRKICMVVYLPSPTGLPPMYNSALSFSNEGYEVETICITSDPSSPRSEIVQEGFIITRLFSLTLKLLNDLFGLSPDSTIKAAIKYVVTYTEFNLKVIWTAFRSKADLYEAHDLPTLLPVFITAGLRRKPVAYHAHELFAEMHKKVRFANFWKFVERLLASRVEVVVTPEENRSKILYKECGVKEMPLTVRNCPPFTEPIQSTKLRDVLAARSLFPQTIVLYQGLFDNSRCLYELINAAHFFNDKILLVLIGSGFHEWEKPEKIIGESKNVIVLPRAPYTELSLYTASADIGVLFYRNDCRNNYYCAPNKVYEYMMMGLPVITNDYPGIAALVRGEKVGLCVDCEKPEEIAAAINWMSENPKDYDTMKSNCLTLSKNTYHWANEFKKLNDKYCEILHVDAE